ncbi:hypothetical protein HU200_020584 [Digitaria exilis]|uniref:Uncharacterized protein n=1 Tax=Digitaria exilis TaxID=1010633 RepID=A0A835KDT6_9POAL|nr:hypothetical protein HU200_020584 [Digitaria exilis]CAB3464085.1 unnamed protein product [Digitaria exilis]
MDDHAAVAAEPGSSAVVVDAEDADDFRLLSVSWNQDGSCFAAATTADFRVFNCSPFHERLRRRVLPSSAASGGYTYTLVEMLFRSNLFALVSSSSSGEKHSVSLWDDDMNKIAYAIPARSAVHAVRVSKDLLAVVLDRTVRVYETLHPGRLLLTIPTALNARGLCCLSCHVASSVLACPGTETGQVRVETNLGKRKAAATRFVDAHASDLACMAMTTDGAVLATASVKGTLVRVFSTMDGTCLQEVRRGRHQAEIYSIALSPNLKWLAVCSDKGTLHVFSLRILYGKKDAAGGKKSAAAGSVMQTDTASNARSSLSFMKGVLPDYFSSEWSFAQFRLPETTRYIAAFGEQNTVMIVGMDGSFDPVNGKQIVRKEYFRFLKEKNSPPIRTLTT